MKHGAQNLAGENIKVVGLSFQLEVRQFCSIATRMYNVHAATSSAENLAQVLAIHKPNYTKETRMEMFANVNPSNFSCLRTEKVL